MALEQLLLNDGDGLACESSLAKRGLITGLWVARN